MRRYGIFLLLSLVIGCGSAECNPFHGKHFILDCNDGVAISLRREDGGITPFLLGIGFDAANKDWKPFFRGAGLRTECLEQSPERARYRFEAVFAGPQAKLVTVKGTVEAYPEWIKLTVEGRYRGDPAELFHSRISFRYPEEDLRLLGAASENGPRGGLTGIRLESAPPLRLNYERARKSSTAPLQWTKRDGEGEFKLELALEPYSGRVPEFSRLSRQPYEAVFEFPRYCNVVLDGDRREATLKVRNRGDQPLAEEARLEIYDFRGNRVSEQIVRLAAAPGETGTATIELPADRYGWFELRLDAPGIAPLSRSFCLLPPVERQHAKGSIFGGIIYPWNRKTVEKLDLMRWVGMSTIRRFYPIVAEGTALPARPEGGVYSAEAAELLLGEQKKRGIEPIPSIAEGLGMPPGSFRLAESSNEANIRRLPVDYAEELKIEYVRTKLHDPNLHVGSTGTAGIDLHWFEELAESGAWDYFDALFVHLHSFPRAPEINNTMTREFWLHDRVTLLRGLMDKYGEKPVYDSENGYLTRCPDRRVEKYPLRSVSESGIAAAFLVRAYLQSLAYGVANKMWFTIDSYGGFGITEYDQPLPAYPAYAAMTRILDGANYAGELLSPGRVSNAMDGEFSRSWFGQATPGLEKELLSADRDAAPTEPVLKLDPYVYIRAFRRPDGAPLLACWATLYRQKVVSASIDTPAWQDQKPGVSLLWNGAEAKTPPAPRPVRFQVGADEVVVSDLMGNSRKVKTDNGFLTLQLDDYPQFVTGANPELLKEAERFSLKIFPAEFRPNDRWKTLIQAVLPAEGKHPARKSVFDKPNLSAELEAGKPYTVRVRLTNLGKEKETGAVTLRLPERWRCEPEQVQFEIAPGREKEVVATFQVTPDAAVAKAKIASVVKSDRLGRVADSVMNVGVRSSREPRP